MSFGTLEHLHGKASNHQHVEPEDKGASIAHSVGKVCDNHSDNSGCDVHRYGHELSVIGRVSQIPENGGQEEADAIQRADDL